jgi:hypothetical protein
MAVDANVLIFERIKEELKNKQSPQTSIFLGYEKVTRQPLRARPTYVPPVSYLNPWFENAY